MRRAARQLTHFDLGNVNMVVLSLDEDVMAMEE
jgi:hypothetical protein